jgi:hypothetical protein
VPSGSSRQQNGHEGTEVEEIVRDRLEQGRVAVFHVGLPRSLRWIKAMTHVSDNIFALLLVTDSVRWSQDDFQG